MDFTNLSDDLESSVLAKECGVELIDIRKIFQSWKKPFTRGIEEVRATRLAVLGTDSAIREKQQQ